MQNKIFRTFLMLIPLIFYFACSRQMTEEKILAKANEIHEKIVTLDTHVDIPLNFATEELNLGTRLERRKVDLVKMKEGGLDGVFFAVFVGQGERTPEGYEKAKEQALTKFDAIHRMCEIMNPDIVELATNPADIRRIEKTGKRIALIGIENGYAIGKDISLLEKYYDLGTRYMTLCHSGHNDICSSSSSSGTDEGAEDTGLTEFGKQVVKEMNRLGIIVDVSHISKKSFYDVIETTKAPIIASHSSCRALCDVSRNLDDDQLLALKRNGGTIQICALGGFLKTDSPERKEALEMLQKEFNLPRRRRGRQEALEKMSEEERSLYEKKLEELDQKYPPVGRANLQDYADHIDHAVRLIGIDHVGIGTDFDGGGGIEGFNDASEALNVTQELLQRGYSEKDIEKIWGGNLLRVWSKIEKVAAQIQKGIE